MEIQSSYLELVIGRVEEVEGEAIATHFFAPFGLPLFPQRSIYVFNERIESRRQIGYQAMPIPFVWKSVLLGYLRVWLGWAAFASPFVMFWGESLDLGRPEWFLTGALFVAWLTVLFVPGRVSQEEAARRRLLHRLTGQYLEPRRLDPFQLEMRLDDLRADAERRGLPTDDPESLRAAIEASDDLDLTLVAFGYACHAAVADKRFAAAANAAWVRLAPTVRDSETARS